MIDDFTPFPQSSPRHLEKVVWVKKLRYFSLIRLNQKLVRLIHQGCEEVCDCFPDDHDVFILVLFVAENLKHLVDNDREWTCYFVMIGMKANTLNHVIKNWLQSNNGKEFKVVKKQEGWTVTFPFIDVLG